MITISTRRTTIEPSREYQHFRLPSHTPWLVQKGWNTDYMLSNALGDTQRCMCQV